MFVALIAVLIALVLDHVAQGFGLSVRRFDWYQAWMRWLDAHFPEDGFWRGRAGIVLALLPPLLLVALFQFAVADTLFGLPATLFSIVVLFYAWGPRDLDLDVEAVVEARDPAQRLQAASGLSRPGEPVSLDGPSLVGAVFGSAKRRWFGVLFWFVLLGPVGALLYRLTAITAENDEAHTLPPDMVVGARILLAILDWPVAQLMTLSMALVGNFDSVIGAWKDAGGASFALDADFLGAAARASVKSELADEAADDTESGIAMPNALLATAPGLPELRDALSLAWRILLVWLVVLALFVIAGWVS
jgi:AmpE protein